MNRTEPPARSAEGASRGAPGEWSRVLDWLAEGVLETVDGAIVRSNPIASSLLGMPEHKGGLVGRELCEFLEAWDQTALELGCDEWVPCRLANSRDGRSMALRTLTLAGTRRLHVVTAVDGDSTTTREALPTISDAGQVRKEAASLCEVFDAAVQWQRNLLSLVSHELRTPITVIRGYGRLLLSEDAGPLLEEQRRFVEESVKSCERLDGFVEELVALSNAPHTDDSLALVERSLDDLLRDVVDYMRPLLRESGATVDLVVAPDANFVLCDPEQIEQLLTNLIGNSLKYAGVAVKIRIHTRPCLDQTRRMVEIAVSDDGPGIPEWERVGLFEPGTRGDLTSSMADEGQGLGLAICRAIVEAQGGRIEFRPASGGGSCFAFLLPAARSGNGSVSADQER